MSSTDAGRRVRPRRWWIPVVVCLVLVAAGVAAVVTVRMVGGESDTGSAPVSEAPPTAKVVRETLIEEVTVKGRLDHGSETPLAVPGAGGILTWLAPVDAEVRRGETLLRVDEQHVQVMYGPIPSFRPLAVDVEGTDVLQFESNLRAFGYIGFTVDQEYSDATAAAVKRWQKDLGREETGVVEPGQIVYVPGPVRIAAHRARLGAPVEGADVLTFTSPKKYVTVDAKIDKVDWAKVGRSVKVGLPGGRTVPGKIKKIGSVVTPPDPGATGAAPAEPPAQDSTVSVTVEVADQKSLGAFDRTPVDVRYTARERKDALTVPVAALLALAEGGYGVEVVESAVSRVVAVEVGMFSDGRVEVSAPELAEGSLVGIPS